MDNYIYEFKCELNKLSLKEIKIYIENINNNLINNNYDIYYLDEEEDWIHLKNEEDLNNGLNTIENSEIKLIINQNKNKENNDLNNLLKEINENEIEEFYNNFEINDEIVNKFNEGKLVCNNCFGKEKMIYDCNICKNNGYIKMNYRELYLTKYFNNLLFKTEKDIKKLIENNILNNINEKKIDFDSKNETIINKNKFLTYICEICGSNPIKTNVYECKICENYQVCQICKEEIIHNVNHNFRLIKNNENFLKRKSYNNKIYFKNYSRLNNNSFNNKIQNIKFKLEYFNYNIQKNTKNIDYLNIKLIIFNVGIIDFPNNFELEFNKKYFKINSLKPNNEMIFNFEINFKKIKKSKEIIFKFYIDQIIINYCYEMKILLTKNLLNEYEYKFYLTQKLLNDKNKKNIFI